MKKSTKVVSKLCLLGIISLCSLGFGQEISYADNNAPGVYVTPTNSAPSDIVMIDWSGIDTPAATYWAVHNWNQGSEAGGYAGFQQHTDKRTVHFSIWDPISTNEAIKAEYLSPNSSTESFGGEGTGRKISTIYPWEQGKYYTLLIRSWTENNHTKYGQWVKDYTGKWTQLGILDFPVPNVNFNHGQTMFQEDWAGTRKDKRSFRMKNGYGRNLSDKQWRSWDQQKIENQHKESTSWNGGATSDYFWAQAGGEENSNIGSGETFKINQPKEPNTGSIDLEDFNVNYVDGQLKASWKLKPTSAPQFKASITVNRNGNVIKTIDNITSYQNTVTSDVQLRDSDVVNLTITDIFDNQKVFTYNDKVVKDKEYEVDFRGYKDREFAVFSHDLETEKGRLETKAINDSIHYMFDKEYASVTVQDAKGKQTFNQSYKGTDTYNAKVDTMTIKEGDYLTFTHLEPNGGDIANGRLSIIDKQTDTTMEKAETITYKVTKNGWVKAEKPQEPTENKPETPKNINASQVTTSSVKLTWDKVNNADEYVIYRDGKKVSTSKENQFNETDLQENTTYSYQIEAIGKDGTSSEKSEPLKVTTKSSDIPNDIREWTLGSFSNPIIYTEGEKVSHKGKIYVVVTTHPNYGDPSWAPDKANSLFRPI